MLPVIGIGTLAVFEQVLLFVQLIREQFAGVGVGQINGAGANRLDFRQDGFDFFIFVPKRILAGVLLLLLSHREVTSTAHQHRGAACTVPVVVVRPLCKAAGVAVKQRVQLFVIVWADFLLLFFDQSGGFVHAGTVFSGCIAVRVGAHAAHIVGSTGQIFVDGIVCCHNSFAPFRVSCCAFRLGSGRFTVRPVKVSGADQMHHGAALYAAFCWAANAYKWFEVFTSAFCKFVSAVACSSHW